MKKHRNFIFLLVMICFLIFPYIVQAEETTSNPNCTQEEKSRLRQLVSLTKVTYQAADCNDEYGYPYKAYTINISGFTSDFYVWQSQRGTLVEYQNNPVATSTCFLPGETIQLPFIASSSSICNGYNILTKTVVLPHYNKYSEEPICIGHEDYELCKKNSPIVLSYDNFMNRMNLYIKSLESENDNDNDNDVHIYKDTIWESIVKFLVANILYITIPVILIGTTAIVVIEVRNRRSIL